MVLESVPRSSVRLRELHLRVHLLQGALRGVELEGALFVPARDRGVPQLRGRQIRTQAAHAVRVEGYRCHLRRLFRDMDGSDRRRIRDWCSVLGRCHRGPVDALLPTRRRPARLPWFAGSHGAVALDSRRPGEQTGGCCRDRVKRGAADPGHRGRSRIAHRLSAFGEFGVLRSTTGRSLRRSRTD